MSSAPAGPSPDAAAATPTQEPVARELMGKESTAALSLRSTPDPVTRLNRTMIVGLIGALVILVVILTFWGLRRPSARGMDSPEHPHNVEHVVRAEGLNSLPGDYASLPKPTTDVPRLGPPIGELGRPVLRKEQEAGVHVLPERLGDQPSPEEDALRAQRLRELQQAETAAVSPVLVQLKRHSGSNEPTGSPSASAAATADTNSALPVQQPTATSSRATLEHKESFLAGSAGNTDSRIYASGTLQTPRSPAQLMAGTIISAALMTGIDSDLPGEIEAQVTSPVHDSVTGRLLLIPQGSRLLGQYDSQISYGQRRVLLVWTRLIMPDGSSIVLDRLPGLNVAGQAGLEDRVDWHGSRLAAGAALSTALSVATELASPNQVATDGSGLVVIGARQGIQDSLNQVAQEITRRNLDVQPTLTIRPGFPVRVLVQKDLILQPYKEFGATRTQGSSEGNE